MRITIHHTAVGQNHARDITRKLRALQSFSQSDELLANGHRKEAWADIPYHFYIDAEGAIAEGRQVHFVGDTNTDYDPTGHIGVVLEGNFDHEQPGEEQKKSLGQLLIFLTSEHGIPADNIGYHKGFAATACPGENLIAALPRILERVRGQ
ncbi:peptidoglycan recognition protein family protein [Salinihabitans flavidus]|uniref:peptidoglycan recognition protein family protein n=1 Tax=Salinihabitans flavidus TaxID=569882 RepID=UPI001C314CFE|nr:peptidoglycan recognition family protein [Salinihabitans flavidus]